MATKMMKIKLLRNIHIAGDAKAAGDVVELEEGEAKYLCAINRATFDLAANVEKPEGAAKQSGPKGEGSKK